MKKITIYFVALILAIGAIPNQAEAKLFKKETVKTESTINAVKLNAMYARLNAIKEMDKSAMSSSERKALRMEVRAMKSEIREGNGGVYLSIGAILIIVLLLIILL